jgi:UDP-N-acetylmuramoyl-tripeptide--D-alanyl-D-alanine ligase
MATAIPDNHASFTAAEIAMVTGGVLHGDPNTRVTGICTDSRAVKKGNLFVALRGETHDADRFVESALANGATAVLAGKPRPEGSGYSQIICEDTLAALGKLAALHRARWESEGQRAIVAITGSAGKTTTKELCAASLAASLGDAAVHATRGNLNNRIGVPMTIFGLTDEHRVAVLEMGTSIRGEIAALCEIAQPDVGVLVNVGVAHAEGLAIPGASPEQAVAVEKSAILAAAGSFAIACADDPWAFGSLARAKARPIGFGRDERALYRLLDVAFEESGHPRLTIERPTKPTDLEERARVSFVVPLLGEVVAIDAAGALAAADAALEILGEESVEPALLEKTLARRVRAVPGRLCLRRRADGALILDDTYNASPAAFASSIEVARRLAEGSKRRLVIVAGEMRELGAESMRAHQEVARKIAAAQPALLVTLGGGADAYNASNVERFANAKEACAIADRIDAGDLVLVKASRGVTAEVVVDAILARGGEITDGPGRGA